MKYTAYLFVEPGMDRPCFSHHEPTDEQLEAFRKKGAKVFSLDLDIPGFTEVDGKLTASPCRIA